MRTPNEIMQNLHTGEINSEYIVKFYDDSGELIGEDQVRCSTVNAAIFHAARSLDLSDTPVDNIEVFEQQEIRFK